MNKYGRRYWHIILVPRAFSRPPSEGGRGREKALGTRMLAHKAILLLR